MRCHILNWEVYCCFFKKTNYGYFNNGRPQHFWQKLKHLGFCVNTEKLVRPWQWARLSGPIFLSQQKFTAKWLTVQKLRKSTLLSLSGLYRATTWTKTMLVKIGIFEVCLLLNCKTWKMCITIFPLKNLNKIRLAGKGRYKCWCHYQEGTKFQYSIK